MDEEVEEPLTKKTFPRFCEKGQYVLIGVGCRYKRKLEITE